MFDAEKITDGIIKFIRDYFEKCNLKGVILGISGGKDSAVVAGLFCKALGSENVIGVTLPCHSKSIDASDAKIVSEYFGFRLFNMDLTKTFDIFTEEFKKGFDILNIGDRMLTDSNINLKPRLRMASVFYIAQAFSNLEKKGYIVAGTSNLCELYVGYFTKGGDSVHDISVLGDLTVEEVIQVGEYIGVPKDILYKTPCDGISDLTDEEKLKVKYTDIAKVIKKEEVSSEILKYVENLHNKNAHKFNMPTFKKDSIN